MSDDAPLTAHQERLRYPLLWAATISGALAGAAFAACNQEILGRADKFDFGKVAALWPIWGVRVCLAAMICGAIFFAASLWVQSRRRSRPTEKHRPALTLTVCLLLLGGAVIGALAAGPNELEPADPGELGQDEVPPGPGPTGPEPGTELTRVPEKKSTRPPPDDTAPEGGTNESPPPRVNEPESAPVLPPRNATAWVFVGSTSGGSLAPEGPLFRDYPTTRSLAALRGLRGRTITPQSGDVVVRCGSGETPATTSCLPVEVVAPGIISDVVHAGRDGGAVYLRISPP